MSVTSLRGFLASSNLSSCKNASEILILLKNERKQRKLSTNRLTSAAALGSKFDNNIELFMFIKSEVDSVGFSDLHSNGIIKLLLSFSKISKTDNSSEIIKSLYENTTLEIRKRGLYRTNLVTLLSIARFENFLKEFKLAPLLVEQLCLSHKLRTDNLTKIRMLIYLSSMRRFCPPENFSNIALGLTTEFTHWPIVSQSEFIFSAGRMNSPCFNLLVKLTPMITRGFVNNQVENSIRPLLSGYTSAVQAASHDSEKTISKRMISGGGDIMNEMSKYIKLTKLSTFSEKSIETVITALVILRGSSSDLTIISDHPNSNQRNIIKAAVRLKENTEELVTRESEALFKKTGNNIKDDLHTLFKLQITGNEIKDSVKKGMRERISGESFTGRDISMVLCLFPDMHTTVIPKDLSFRHVSDIVQSLSKVGIGKSPYYELLLNSPPVDKFLPQYCIRIIGCLTVVKASKTKLFKFTMDVISANATSFPPTSCALILKALFLGRVRITCDVLFNSIILNSSRGLFPSVSECPMLLVCFANSNVTPDDDLIRHYCSFSGVELMKTRSLVSYVVGLARIVCMSDLSALGVLKDLLFNALKRSEAILMSRDWEQKLDIPILMKFLNDISYPGYHGIFFKSMLHFSNNEIINKYSPNQILFIVTVISKKHFFSMNERLHESIIRYIKKKQQRPLYGDHRLAMDTLMRHPFIRSHL